MTTTTYSRTSGTAILPGTWAYVQNRGDIPNADKLNPAERYDYDQAKQDVRDQYKALAMQPLTEPPAFLRFALGTNSDPLAAYDGEGNPAGFAGPGTLAGISVTDAAARLSISEDRLINKLGTFTGPVILAILPKGTLIYRTVGLATSDYGVNHGLVTNGLLGDFWEPTSPNIYADVAEWRSKTAVLAEWNGDYGHIVVCLAADVPVLTGTVGEQRIGRDGHKVLPGGGKQHYIPNLTDAHVTEPLAGRALKDIIQETLYGAGIP